jgi:hypothetical protein
LAFTTTQFEISYRATPTAVAWGEKVTHEAVVSVPGTGERIANVEVRFQWFVEGAWRDIASVKTDITGVATFTWTVPFRFQVAPDRFTTLPCGSYSTRAFIPATTQYSTTVTVKVAYPTKITASTNKTSYAPGETVTVTGRLTRVEETAETALAGKTVTITWWDGSTTNVTTDTGGNFTASKTGPSATGTYKVTVAFAGEGLALEVPVVGVGGRIITAGAIALATATAILAPKLIHSIRVR